MYIGIKYPQLRNLHLNIDYEDLIEDLWDSLRDSFLTAVMNMKRLKNYSVDVFATTRPVFNVMKKNNVELEHFGFFIDNIDPIEETFSTILTSPAVSTVSSLAMTCGFETDTSLLCYNFNDLCLHLELLTSLEITCYCDNTPILIISVLQTLTTLRNLVLKEIQIKQEPTDELFYNKLTNVRTGSLESISLAYSTYKKHPTTLYQNPISFLLLFFSHVQI